MATAVFGGTFDPFHNGHLAVIDALNDMPRIRRILLIPNPIAPHKAAAKAPADVRLEMLRAILEATPAWEAKCLVSEIELQRNEAARTVDTLAALAMQKWPRPFCLAIGSDSYFELHLWKDFEALLGMVDVLVFARKGADPEKYRGYFERHLAFASWDRFQFLSADFQDVSSQEIREKLASNEDVSGLVPGCIREIIKRYNLYTLQGENE
jgi:nicotinate-nucleotide adenylyltransferase